MMAKLPSDQRLQMHKTYGDLLHELKVIWDEVGESNDERDKILGEIEKECSEVYKRKIDQAYHYRAQLKQTIAQTKGEIAIISSTIAEAPMQVQQWNQQNGSLKEELKLVNSQLLEMHNKKSQRLNQFLEVMEKMRKILIEIDPTSSNISIPSIDESNLSIGKLEQLKRTLRQLQDEKVNRTKKVADHVNTLDSLCQVLGMDLKQLLKDMNADFNEVDIRDNISDASIARLFSTIQRLQIIKRERMDKLQDLARSMLELWNLMDTPSEEQQIFQNVTCNIAASEDEMIEVNALSEEFIHHVEEEVFRLQELKASKMKELVTKKKIELEELCTRAHIAMETDSELFTFEALENAAVDSSYLLEQIEVHISVVKEEAYNRKDILERVEKWLAACEEESWLEEYNRDENRYNAGKGTHLALKRAEKARALINKIPAMVEALLSKITTWEDERGIEFNYDGTRLLSLLDDYTIMRQEKEQEKRRQRDEKRLQGMITIEQETVMGSKSPLKNTKKVTRTFSSGRSRKSTVGVDFIQSTRSPRTTMKGDEEATQISD